MKRFNEITFTLTEDQRYEAGDVITMEGARTEGYWLVTAVQGTRIMARRMGWFEVLRWRLRGFRLRVRVAVQSFLERFRRQEAG